MKYDTQKLIDLFLQADRAAREADPWGGKPESEIEEPEPGTCNFDTPAIRLPGIWKTQIEKIKKATGLRIADFSAWGTGWYWVFVTMYGQAERRTIMMEAAQKILDASEYESCGYFQMD